MALITPVAKTMPAFDATADQVFSFSVSGGDGVVQNRITIVEQSTNTVVYQDTTALNYYTFNHTVPANTLTNGTYYYYYFNTFNSSGDMSADSNLVAFYCYTTPVLTFTNVPIYPEVVSNSTYTFNLTYSQAEGELLNYLIFTLYDSTSTVYSVSDKIYANSANSYDYEVTGMVDGNYTLNALAYTVNNTEVTLTSSLFTVELNKPSSTTKFEAEVKCDEGYVQVEGAIRTAVGTVRYEPAVFTYPTTTYEDGTRLALFPPQNYVKFDDGFAITADFTMRIIGTIGETGEIFRMWNDDGIIIKGNLLREYPYGTTTAQDAIEIIVLDGDGVQRGWGRSNYVDILNPTDLYTFTVRKVGTTWTLTLERDAVTTFSLNWNDTSTVQYGQMTPISWNEGTVYTEGSSAVNYFENVDSLFTIRNFRLSNGEYDHFYITSDVTTAIEDMDFETWDLNTIIASDFNGNLNGTDNNIILQQIASFRLKRRAEDSNTWITLFDKSVSSSADFTFTFIDSYVPSGIKQYYAMVLVTSSGDEGDYNTIEVTPYWNGCFLTAGEYNFKLYANVNYNSITNNRQYGILQPLKSKYPIVVKNSYTAYLSGAIQGTILNSSYYTTRTLDRQGVIEQVKVLQSMLDLGSAICLKDWNGWIILAKPTSGDTATFNSNWGNGVLDLSFNFVEQGRYDSQSDLYRLGIIDVDV